MIIKLRKHGYNSIKTFQNKKELFDYVKKYCSDTIYTTDYKDVLASKILNSDNYNKFTISQLIELTDCDRVK